MYFSEVGRCFLATCSFFHFHINQDFVTSSDCLPEVKCLLHNFHELFIFPLMQCASFCRLQILIFHVSSEVSQKISKEFNMLNLAHVHGEFAKRNLCVSGIFDTGYTFQEKLKSFFLKINNSFAGSNCLGRKLTQFASLQGKRVIPT